MEKKKLIVVLGMHRSGTSAITRALKALGVELGDSLLPPVNGDNDKGYWEDADINALNIEMLNALEYDWNSWASASKEDLTSPKVNAYKLRALDILRAKLRTSDVIGLKDPRISRLMPFWISVFERLPVEVSFIIALRHPMSVAQSLIKRDKSFPAGKAYRLWLDYSLSALEGTSGQQRIVVDYDLLMVDPVAQLKRIAATCNLSMAEDSSEVREYIDCFLEDRLRHTHFEEKDLELDESCTAGTIDLYRMLLLLAKDSEECDFSAEVLTRIKSHQNESRTIYRYIDNCEKNQIQLLSDISELRERNDSLVKIIQGKDNDITNLQKIISDQKDDLEQQLSLISSKSAALDDAILELSLRNEEIEKLIDKSSELESYVEELHRNMKAKEDEYTHLREESTHLKDQLSVKDYKISLMSEDIRKLGQIVLEKEKLIDLFQRSTSWRITYPIRLTKHLFILIAKLVYLPFKAVRLGGGLVGTARKIAGQFRQRGLKGLYDGFRYVLNYSFIASESATEHSDGLSISPDSDNDLKPDRNDYLQWISNYDTLRESERQKILDDINGFIELPKISIVMPTYNPNVLWLSEAIQSVQQQLYPNWELCIADDCSPNLEVIELLREVSDSDSRVKVRFRQENGHISAASNSALELVTGDWVALLDHDDLLPEHALYWVAKAILNNESVRMIYSDEDKIDERGVRYAPYFKSDWNIDLFYSHNMICHLGVYSAQLVKEVGGFRLGLEGAQDYDLALRCIERISPDQIFHIPRILYHWRTHAGSTAGGVEAKPYAVNAGERAINDHFARCSINAEAKSTNVGYRAKYRLPEVLPKVSLIIPTRNGVKLVRQCISSILEKTTYENYEIILVDNGSDDPEALAYFKYLADNKKANVIRDDSPFNYSSLNNNAVKVAVGEIIGLINNDIEVIEPNWLGEMVSIALQDGVGAVGAKLLYPDDSLQHGGVVLGVGGVAGHSHKHISVNDPGYFSRAGVISSFSAVTAACLIIRKSIYEQVEGLNETDLTVAFNDVDFCLRVREAGYRNVWTPYALLYHHESATRGFEDNPEKQARFSAEISYMKKRWGDLLIKDPAYSPNLTLEHEDFSLAWPPRVEEMHE